MKRKCRRPHRNEQEDTGEEWGLPPHEVMQVFTLLAEAKQAAVCDWLEASHPEYIDTPDYFFFPF